MVSQLLFPSELCVVFENRECGHHENHSPHEPDTFTADAVLDAPCLLVILREVVGPLSSGQSQFSLNRFLSSHSSDEFITCNNIPIQMERTFLMPLFCNFLFGHESLCGVSNLQFRNLKSSFAPGKGKRCLDVLLGNKLAMRGLLGTIVNSPQSKNVPGKIFFFSELQAQDCMHEIKTL